MKAALVLLFILAVVLAWQLNSQKRTTAEQSKRLDELSARLEVKPKMASLELQEKCARQAREQYRLDGWEKEKMAGFSTHYNQDLNRCLMLIENTDAKTSSGTIWTNKTLVDAFEGKVFGTYMWHSDKVKKYWEVPPVQCEVTLPSGEKKICNSSDEFDALVKTYME